MYVKILNYDYYEKFDIEKETKCLIENRIQLV